MVGKEQYLFKAFYTGRVNDIYKGARRVEDDKKPRNPNLNDKVINFNEFT